MVIFTVECFSAIIAKGLWQHDEAYLKVCKNILLGNTDFCWTVYHMLGRPPEHVELPRLHHRHDRLHRHLLINDAGLFQRSWCMRNLLHLEAFDALPFTLSLFNFHTFTI